MELVFDIETVGCKMTDLSETQQEYLLRYAEKEKDEEMRAEKIEEAERYLSLYPFTAKVVAIGLLNTETEHSLVLYEGEGEWESEEKNVKYRGVAEEEILELFWGYLRKVERVITFNGRNFDLPFLMLRSAVLKIKPSVNLLGSRFDSRKHLDLLEALTFHGITRKFNLDFYCRAFGVESPKAHGVTGMDVKELYNAGRIKEVAVYCGNDIQATYELYKIYREFLDL